MWLFRVLRWLNRLMTWLSGNKRWDEQFKLFQVDPGLTAEEVYERLIPLCYQYNYLGATNRNQILQVRKLIDKKHQIHLRLYKNDWLTGHYELQPDFDPRAHLKGEDLRELTISEEMEIRGVLGVIR
jgi:hypothetical protein